MRTVFLMGNLSKAIPKGMSDKKMAPKVAKYRKLY
jgi:hypothetical protein